MVSHLTRTEALRVLELDSSADVEAVKRAYRRLARRLHPDAGGDTEDFHRLRVAYERLMEGAEDLGPRGPRTRASRPRRASWAESPTRLYSDLAADTSSVDWSTTVPDGPLVRATRDRVAVLLARPDGAGSVHPVSARSRGPRSPLNRLIPLLDPDLTATWTVGPASGRGRAGHDVQLRLRAWSRSSRRRIDRADLPPGWTAERGSSSVTLGRVLHPNRDRRETATRATDALTDALTALGWPLESWFLVARD